MGSSFFELGYIVLKRIARKKPLRWLTRFCPKVSCDQNLSGRNILINFLLTKSPSLQKNCSDLLYLQAKLNIKTGPDRWLTLNFLVVIHVFDVKYCVITSAFSQKITVL